MVSEGGLPRLVLVSSYRNLPLVLKLYLVGLAGLAGATLYLLWSEIGPTPETTVGLLVALGLIMAAVLLVIYLFLVLSGAVTIETITMGRDVIAYRRGLVRKVIRVDEILTIALMERRGETLVGLVTRDGRGAVFGRGLSQHDSRALLDWLTRLAALKGVRMTSDMQMREFREAASAGLSIRLRL